MGGTAAASIAFVLHNSTDHAVPPLSPCTAEGAEASARRGWRKRTTGRRGGAGALAVTGVTGTDAARLSDVSVTRIVAAVVVAASIALLTLTRRYSLPFIPVFTHS